jgi:hypothetical protein
VPEIEATIKKVQKEEDTGWGTIETDHPQVKKLTTKISEKLSEAAAFKRSGERVSISYTQKDRTVDTDNGPRTFHNYYYERAAATNGASASDDGIDVIPAKKAETAEGIETISSREEPASKRWSIALQGGGKCAVATLPLMPPTQRDFETQKTIARAWAEFFFFTPPPERPTMGVSEQRTGGRGAYDEPRGIEQPPVDDDIPF